MHVFGEGEVLVRLLICTGNVYVGFSVTACDGMVMSLCLWVVS